MARWTKMILLKNGVEVAHDITAIIADNGIRIEDTNLPIEENDTLREILSNGLPEDYFITDRGYQAHPRPCYLAQYTKIKPTQKELTKHVTYNLHGNNPRVYNESVDSSVNISEINLSIKFTEIRDAIKTIPDSSIHPVLLAKLDALEAAMFTETISQKTKEFIELAANCTTILTPFFPFLTSLAERVIS